MPLKIAIQMDPPETLDVSKDSTFVLGLEAQKRGHSLFYYSAESLSLSEERVTASCAALQFHRRKNDPYTLQAFEETDLKTFDIILMRNDFNDALAYDAMTHILDHVTDDVLVLNNPTGTRESPEKMLITHYPDLAAPTLITRNLDDIRKFQKQHKELIIKPFNGFGGLDIYHIKEGDDNLKVVFEMLCRLHSEPFIVQKYLPEIKQGDKRIIVVAGEPIAALMRVPNSGEARANLAVGGKAVAGEITERDRKICEKLKPELNKRGLVFVGLDVIGDYVTEINPKSPTGLQHIYKLQGIKCEEAIWDAFEARFADRKSR